MHEVTYVMEVMWTNSSDITSPQEHFVHSENVFCTSQSDKKKVDLYGFTLRRHLHDLGVLRRRVALTQSFHMLIQRFTAVMDSCEKWADSVALNRVKSRTMALLYYSSAPVHREQPWPLEN